MAGYHFVYEAKPAEPVLDYTPTSSAYLTFKRLVAFKLLYIKTAPKDGRVERMTTVDLKKPENILELIKFQKDLIKQYYRYMGQLVRTQYKNAAILSYWLKDHLRYLKSEHTFNPNFNMRYKRGQIVYANFGYRIGSELGGCHYAIVLDVHNAKSNSQLTVVPMKSKRDKETAYSKLYHVDLYEEVQLLLEKKGIDIMDAQAARINSIIHQYGLAKIDQSPEITKMMADAKRQLAHAQAIEKFAKKLNHESIADVGQICTISKIRIVHPLNKRDVLFDVCLSDDAMKRIEKQVKYLFFSK